MSMKTPLALLFLMVSITAFASTPNNEDCAGEIGAAYGFCVAASHLGCGTGAYLGGYCYYESYNSGGYIFSYLSISEGTLTPEEAAACEAAHQVQYDIVCN